MPAHTPIEAQGRESTSSRSLPTWALDASYVAFTVVLFAEVLVAGARLLDRDLMHFFYPMGRTLRAAWHGSASFLWDSGINHGMPLLARWTSAVFYPAHWLYALFRADLAVTLAVLLHLPLAASSTLRLARRYTGNTAAAWVAGLGFAFGGYLLSMVGGGTYLFGAALLPLSLLCVHRVIEQPRLARSLQLALVLALQVFCPDPQTLYFEVLVCVPVVLWLRAPAGGRLRPTLAVGGAGLIALVLTLCQTWPLLEFVQHSSRQGFSLGGATAWSFHPLRLLELVVPGVFGGLQPENTLWAPSLFNASQGRPWALAVHVGLLPLVAAALGWRERRTFAAWGGLTLFSLVCAFGSWTPLYRLVLLLPGVDQFRYPEKHLVFVTLGLCLLGAAGLGRLLSGARAAAGDGTRTVVVVLGTIALVLALARAALWLGAEQFGDLVRQQEALVITAHARAATGAALVRALALALVLGALLALRHRLRHRVAVGLLLAICAVDLLSAGLPLRLLGGAEWIGAPSPLRGALPPAKNGRQPLIWRNPRLAYPGEPAGSRAPASVPERHRRWEWRTLKANVAVGDCARYAVGYEAALLGRNVALYNALHGNLGRFLDVLGVECFIDAAGRHAGAYPVIRTYAGLGVALYRNPDALPFAFARGRALTVRDSGTAIRRLVDPTFPLAEVAVLESEQALHSYPPARRAVRVVRYLPGEMEIAVRFERPGYLVVLETCYPGWHASIDGKAGRILPANGAFIGVPVPAGKHRVALRFAPAHQAWAAGISLATLLLVCVAGGAASWRARRRRNGRAG